MTVERLQSGISTAFAIVTSEYLGSTFCVRLHPVLALLDARSPRDHQGPLRALDSDAYQMMWAENPVLQDNEIGSTEFRTVAYIHKPAAYRAEKDGGAGVLHLPSHAAAFRAQWIRRWLEPGHQPWKLVIDYWVLNDSPYGRAHILRGTTLLSILKTIPRQQKFLKQCFRDFMTLEITQATGTLDAHVQSEPVLDNARVSIPPLHRNKSAAADLKRRWIRTLNLVHMHNLVNELTDEIITADEMRGQCYEYAPNPTL